jgi:hypothetical protein
MFICTGRWFFRSCLDSTSPSKWYEKMCRHMSVLRFYKSGIRMWYQSGIKVVSKWYQSGINVVSKWYEKSDVTCQCYDFYKSGIRKWYQSGTRNLTSHVSVTIVTKHFRRKNWKTTLQMWFKILCSIHNSKNLSIGFRENRWYIFGENWSISAKWSLF